MPVVKLLIMAAAMFIALPCVADTVSAVATCETASIVPAVELPSDSQVVKLELKDADIRDVLIARGEQAYVNIVSDPT